MERYAPKLAEIEAMMKKTSKMENFTLTPSKKEKIAIMLESFSTAMRQGQVQDRAAVAERKTMMEAVGGTGLSDVGPYQKFGINMITAVMANVVADQLVSVQPMTNRIGEVRYLKYKYASTKGGAAKGDVLSSALEFGGGKFEYTSDEIEAERVASSGATTITATLSWRAVKAGSVKLTAGNYVLTDDGAGKLLDSSKANKGTIDYVTGAISATVPALPADMDASYMYITTDPNPMVPEITAEVSVMPMEAKSRKLKTAFSYDAAFDMQGDYGFDMDAEQVAFFSAEIAHEIDGEIMKDLWELAVGQNDKVADFSQTAPTGVSYQDHIDSFWSKAIIAGGNMIFTRLKRGAASFIIAGINVCTIIESHRNFVKQAFNATGPHICGYLNGVPVVKNPYYAVNDYVIGYQGSQLFDTGYIYAPYMPVTTIDIIKDDGFTFGKGFVTAYGKKAINAKCYAYGKIVA